MSRYFGSLAFPVQSFTNSGFITFPIALRGKDSSTRNCFGILYGDLSPAHPLAKAPVGIGDINGYSIGIESEVLARWARCATFPFAKDPVKP